jgi:voltage-gated potassium channel
MPASRNPLQQLRVAVAVLACLLLGGVVGYMWIEGWSFFKALYMVMITVSTIGFSDYNMSDRGKAFTILLIVFGTATWLWVGMALIEGLLERSHTIQRWRVTRMVQKLRDHYIVCGYGRIGHQIVGELRRHKQPFVVVDSEPAALESLLECECPHVVGDATHEDTLRQARIEHAKGLIAAVATDSDNVFIVLTARDLNPTLSIIARAGELETEHKLRRAGANRVVSPYVLGGRRIATAVLYPHVIDFLETLLHSDDVDLGLAEATVQPESELAGKTLLELQLPARIGVTVVAIRKPDKRFVANPSATTLVEPADVLIAIGDGKQLESLYSVARARAVLARRAG